MIDLNTKFGRFVKKRLKDEYFVWLTTVDSTGTPQPRPVWFIWENDTVLIYSQAKAYKVGHIQHNPNVSLHFNSADPKGEQGLVMLTSLLFHSKCIIIANNHGVGVLVGVAERTTKGGSSGCSFLYLICAYISSTLGRGDQPR